MQIFFVNALLFGLISRNRNIIEIKNRKISGLCFLFLKWPEPDNLPHLPQGYAGAFPGFLGTHAGNF